MGPRKLSSVEETAPLQLLALEPHLFRRVLSDPQPQVCTSLLSAYWAGGNSHGAYCSVQCAAAHAICDPKWEKGQVGVSWAALPGGQESC